MRRMQFGIELFNCSKVLCLKCEKLFFILLQSWKIYFNNNYNLFLVPIMCFDYASIFNLNNNSINWCEHNSRSKNIIDKCEKTCKISEE